MTLILAPMDNYRVFQRDVTNGNPPGGTTTYDKGWGEVDLQVTSDVSASLSYQIVDAQDSSHIIQDWTSTNQKSVVGTTQIKLNLPASEDCYKINIAPSADLSNAVASNPLFMGNIDVAAGQSKATGMFSSYAYSTDDPAAQPEQYVPFSFSSRVYSAVTNDPTSNLPESWLPPGNVDTPGGAVQTTFAAEFLAERQGELGVACALIGLDKPGSSINDWLPGTANYFYLAATIERAGGKVANFVWNQGESDWNASGAEDYLSNFKTLVGALDHVITSSYRVVGFDYAWVQGNQPQRYLTEVREAKEEVADAHQGSFEEGVSAGDDAVIGHPSMQSRLLAADDLYRQILSLDNPLADQGPALSATGIYDNSRIDITVVQDKGNALLGQVIQFGGPQVTYRVATPQELSSQFTVFEKGFTDSAHQISVLGAEVVSPTDIRLTLSSTPTGPVEVWYRSDYGGGIGDTNAVFRDNDTSDGISFGHGLQTRLTPVEVSFGLPPDPAINSGFNTSTPPANPTGSIGDPASTTTTTPTTVPTTTATAADLVIDVSEDAWDGDAQFTVSIDGQQVGGIYTATASHADGQSQAFTIPNTLSAGDHKVSVAFINDAYGGSASNDRNLYLDDIKVDNKTVQGSSTSLTFNEALPYDVTIPAGDPASTTTTTPTTVPTTTATAADLVIDVSEDAWDGDAQFTVSIDGQQVGGIYTATASHADGQSQAFTIPNTLSAGDHKVSVAFINDAYGGSASNDRNLYLDDIKVDNKTVQGSSTSLTFNEALPYDVTIPAGDPASTTTTTPTTVPTTTATAADLVIDVSEDAWDGDAQFTVSIDGQQVGGIYTATASHADGQSQAFTIPNTLSAGDHKVSVAFINDAYGGSASNDRNLYLDDIKVDNKTVQGSSTSLTFNEALPYDVTIPAGDPASTTTTTPTTVPTTTATAADLVIDVSEDAWDGDAQFTVSIDGQQVGGIYTATASHADGQSQAFTIPNTLSAGDHKVSVAFINDAYGGSASNDRNLYLDDIKVDNKTVQGSSTSLTFNEALPYDVTIPAGDPASTTTTTPTTVPTTTATAADLVIDVSEDAWDGDAQFTVSIDGQQVGGIYTATASHADGQSQAFTIPNTLSAGDHKVSVAFINDAYGGSASNDRNLYLDDIKVDNKTVQGSSTSLTFNEALPYDVTIPAGDPASTTTTTPTTVPTTTATAADLVIDVSEDAWDGDAQFTVSIDGQQVGGIYTATASHADGQSQAFTIPNTLSAGDHKVSVAFINDAYGGSASNDRNLYLDDIKVDNKTVQGSSTSLTFNEALPYDVTIPAGDPAILGGVTLVPNGNDSDAGIATSTSQGQEPASGQTPLAPLTNSTAGLLATMWTIDPIGKEILTVGIGKQFSTISAAVSASKDGDLIQVDAGTYTNDFIQTWKSLTIVGVGGMVNLVATELCPNGKAILTVDDDLTLANFTFQGAKVTDGNGAGIRYESGNLTLINDAFYSNENGVLGGVTNGTVTIQNSLFSGNGSGTGYTHNLYIGQSNQLTVRDSIFENARVGHELKSRALSNTLTGNIFTDGPAGTASYDIDLPDGGVGVIKNNVIEKGPLSENDAMIHFGGEGLPYADSSLIIEGNTFINDKGQSTVAFRNETLVTAQITNNTFTNLDAHQLASGAATLDSNKDENGSTIADAVADPFPSNTSEVYTDTLDHTVVLNGSPLLNVRGGSGHLVISAETGRTLTVGGSGGINFTEQQGSGANQITTSVGSVNQLNLIGEDLVSSNGTDSIQTGDASVSGTITGDAEIQSGTGYDHWFVTGRLTLDINGGAPNVTLASGSTAVISGTASGLNLSTIGGSAVVDVTTSDSDVIGQHISFSILAGSASAFIYDNSSGITTAAGTPGASIRLGASNEQVTSNGTDEIWAGSGADTVIVSGSNSVIHASTGDLSVFGRGIKTGSEAKVFGDGGNVSLNGDTGNIIYYGGDAANSVNLLLSHVSLIGGAGLMTIHNTAYSETIVGGLGGLDYYADGNASGAIATAESSFNSLNLGSNPDIIVDSWGTDTIFGGSGSITAHGDTTVSGGVGTRSLSLFGRDVVNGVGQDNILANEGSNVIYNVGQSGSVHEIAANVSLFLPNTAEIAATLSGGDASLTVDAEGKSVISTSNLNGTGIVLNSGNYNLFTGGADRIQNNAAFTSVTVASDNVSILGGVGDLTVLSQDIQHGGLNFISGSGYAKLNLFDAGEDSITFGSGTTDVSLNGGKGNIFNFFSDQGGGLDTISGFRVGTDKVFLHGLNVSSEAVLGGTLNVILSNQSQLHLLNLTNDRGVFT